MGADAVAYLRTQINYYGPRSRTTDFLSRYSIYIGMTNMYDSYTRSFLARVALKYIGPKAEAAVPELLGVWAYGRSLFDMRDCEFLNILTLKAILDVPQIDAIATQSSTFVPSVIGEAARRYPKVAEELGIPSASGK